MFAGFLSLWLWLVIGHYLQYVLRCSALLLGLDSTSFGDATAIIATISSYKCYPKERAEAAVEGEIYQAKELAVALLASG